MKIIFMGTPEFSVTALHKLLQLPAHEIVAVYSQPPRRAGRGKKIVPSPVHQLAESAGIPVETPLSFKQAEDKDKFANYQADLAIVVAYGLILPQAVLDMPRYGCINIHASLLPRWRGAAPIQRAIEAGDRDSGVALMQMAAGLDTGPVLSMSKLTLSDQETGQTLHDKLSQLGADMLPDLLDQIEQETCQAIPQSEDGVTYAHKLDKSESVIDWSENADVIDRRIRAFTPWPGTQTTFGTEMIKIKAVKPYIETDIAIGSPGYLSVMDQRLVVSCGNGHLEILRLQRPGKSVVSAGDFLRGYQGDLPEKFG